MLMKKIAVVVSAKLAENQMTSTPVQVFIRVRPTEENSESIKVISNNQIIVPNPRNNTESITYTFDRVFKQDSKQKEIWKYCKPIITSSLEGKNCSVFAYGQTGSGKTHTMLKGEGVVQLTISELLQNKNTSISASYLEIYNEKIFDLLSDSQAFLELRQNGSEISLTGCTVVDVSSLDAFNRQLGLALKNRSTASTFLNHSSSRSHFILKLQVSTFKNAEKPTTSKIHLIDLAGSEDNKRTNNIGARMEESCAINKSLFVLGQVVEALNKNLPRIPYRDSKITRFLQDSLGGNSQTLLIACVSPHSTNLYDTYNTLNFATKSSLIKNVVSVNEFQSVKVPTESIAGRSEALKAWKKNKNTLSNDTCLNSLKQNLQEKTPDHAEKLESELSLKLSKTVELTIEQRVNARIKEIAENLMR
jgi:kinesin family protein 22